MNTLDGKTCVVTGATSGIGLATAEQLAAMGARLVLVGRDRAKGEAARAHLARLHPAAAVELVYGDLSRLAEMRQVAQALLAAAPRIDVLVNNAGAIFNRRHETPDGFELTFALNHLGYFVLTRHLEARLAQSAPARIVNVASVAHWDAVLDFGDLQMTRNFDGWTAYRRSKLCNILFTRELARRLAGTGVTANCLHPGFVASRFGDNNAGLFRVVIAVGKRLIAISTERGAETSTYLASAPEVAAASGLYFAKCRASTPSAAAQDDAAARRLWDESTRLAAGFLP
jgi:NAD(P)-dependent dehydrogenase (short-subunit alcohol dehydrogenase family)